MTQEQTKKMTEMTKRQKKRMDRLIMSTIRLFDKVRGPNTKLDVNIPYTRKDGEEFVFKIEIRELFG